jgi:hypothetical protein
MIGIGSLASLTYHIGLPYLDDGFMEMYQFGRAIETVIRQTVYVRHEPSCEPDERLLNERIFKVPPEIRNIVLDLATIPMKNRQSKLEAVPAGYKAEVDRLLFLESLWNDNGLRRRIAAQLQDNTLIQQINTLEKRNGSFSALDKIMHGRIQMHNVRPSVTKEALYDQMMQEFTNKGWGIWQIDGEVNQQMTFLKANIEETEMKMRQITVGHGNFDVKYLARELEERKNQFLQYSMEIKLRAMIWRGRRDM